MPRKLAVGDQVYVTNTPGKHNGYPAKVTDLKERDGTCVEVTVYGGRGNRLMFHAVTPDRIKAKSDRKVKRSL